MEKGNIFGNVLVGVLVGVILLFFGILILTPLIFKWGIADYENKRPIRSEIYKIPEDAEYLTPRREDYSSYSTSYNRKAWNAKTFPVVSDSETGEIDFELLTSDSRNGCYHYYVWIKELEKGIVYLKAFENNTNEQIRMENTVINISEFHDGMKRYGPHFFDVNTNFSTFSDYYLARFELWHKNQSDVENLLLTKYYLTAGGNTFPR